MTKKATPARKPESVFTRAKPVVKAQVETKKVDLVPVPGLARYAAIAAIEKFIRTTKDTMRVPVATLAFARWVDETISSSKRPENFRGVDAQYDNGALRLDEGKQASIEFRKRATNSPLKDEEVAILEADDVPFDVVPLTSGSSVFAINAKYETDAELMQRVGEAIAAVKGLPEDFIIQPVKRVVSEESLQATFKKRATETSSQYVDRVNRLMPLVGVMGIKPVTDEDPLTLMSDLVKDFQDADADAAAADQGKALTIAIDVAKKKKKAA